MAIITMLVLSVSVYVLRNKEMAYLEQDIQQDQAKIDALLASATTDAIITVDIPALRTVLDGVIANHPQVHRIEIADAQGRTLYSAGKSGSPPPGHERTHHSDILVGGEKFGSSSIVWDLLQQYREIDQHLAEVRIYTGLAMAILALFLTGPLYLLVARPLGIIRKRIDAIAMSRHETMPTLNSSRELHAVSTSLNKLAFTLNEQTENERAYRERLEKEVAERTTELNNLYEEMKYFATHDRLTTLPNRGLLADHAQLAFARTKREGTTTALLYIDMDGFKAINDRYGHQAGDDVLITLAKRIKGILRAEDTVARMGGDEFCVLLPNLAAPSDAATVAEKIISTAGNNIHVGDLEYSPKLSLGIALYPQDATNLDSLLKMADTAMYHAKESGGNGYYFYNLLLQNESSKHLALKNEIQRAINDNELVLFFQPIIDLVTGKILSFEALIRWQHPQKGLISPSDFIPLAEQSGQIVQIDQWVIESLIGQIQQFSDVAQRPVKISANLSSRSFRNNGLFSQLQDNKTVSALLDIEITESTLLINDARSQNSFDSLKKNGVRLTLDDFGTGFSSLSYLTTLPISGIKIDRSFIDCVQTNEKNSVVVTSILTLCKQLGLSTVAEGVETKQELDWLRANKCDSAQGYYFSRPVPFTTAIELLKKDFKSQF